MHSSSSNADPAKSLPTGSPDHYTAFVGPPDQYDFMGATQFRLLCALGLRENHALLDFGCGSLRAGRLFIPYLKKNRYFGIDPNKWLIDEAVRNEIGESIVKIKECAFDFNANFDCSVFMTKFDYIIAQSIFSHSGKSEVRKTLASFRENLKEDGLIAATFVLAASQEVEHASDGWVYPGCVYYSESSIAEFAEESHLYCVKIPWYHPRQSWFLFSCDSKNLPDAETASTYLKGTILKNQPAA
ncbi:cyclopropane fatty-acyl-phospholipid synthase-like methyltransferase [Mesorhizobium shonense]|uniref:Cyclopropane fatty-acyl-phospholipid synthase-like methyltransferase n=1 Tax=Mesorhizobium shonense TaxID=1209948 RepID=A0ABV2I3I3_9HYPH